MRRFVGSTRFGFDTAFVMRRQRYAIGELNLSCIELCKLLTEWRAALDSARGN
jgi:hypothetical protein